MDYHDFIWDLGGTLLDNYETSTKAFVATLQYFQREANHDSVYAALKVSTDYAVQQFASDFPDFLGEYKKREKKALEIPCLFEGTEELLDRLTADGARHFLVSHRDHHVETILEKTGIRHYFTEVVTADDGFPRKPDPTSMLYLKDKYAIESGLVIGDRPIDIEAGQRAGMATYLFDSMDQLSAYIFN